MLSCRAPLYGDGPGWSSLIIGTTSSLHEIVRPMPDQSVYALRQELTELQVQLLRKRSEVSNLTVGYRRAEEGVGAIPVAPLRKNLTSAKDELQDMESHAAQLERQIRQLEAESQL